MKPPPFEYHAPASVDKAVSMLASLEDAKVLAGGQSLVPLLNFRLARPAHIVDINRIETLTRVYERDGGIAVGAIVRQSDAERDDLLGRKCALVPKALQHVAHFVIRNRGTVVGSIAHADSAAEMPAVLLALGGHVVARSQRGERVIDAKDLFLGAFETSLQPDELITEAIGRVHPNGVDVASGVERAPGVKDPEKMRRFFEAVRAADESAPSPFGRGAG